MRNFLEVLEGTPPTPVDCGTCPVSIACATGTGGNGYRFPCCGVTGVPVDGNVLLVIDCERNRFELHAVSTTLQACPLCTGGIMEVMLLGMGGHNRYVPTVYAKVPLPERLRLWKKKLAQARKNIADGKPL